MGGREVGGLSNLLSGHRDLANPEFGFECRNAEGVTVFGFKHALGEEGASVDAGERVRIAATIDGALMPGIYVIRCWVVRDAGVEEIALQFIDILKFAVEGGLGGPGLVSVPAEVQITAEGS